MDVAAAGGAVRMVSDRALAIMRRGWRRRSITDA